MYLEFVQMKSKITFQQWLH